MKKYLLYLFFLLFLTSSFSQSQFQITYSYDGFNICNSVKNASSGYIAAGWAYGSVNFLPVGLVMQTDLLGNVVWAKRYRGDSFGFTPLIIWDMQNTSAGGYIMTGTRGSTSLLMNT